MRNFEPIIHIMEDEQSLLVMFDSGWEDDSTRMPRLVRIALPIQDLSWKMDLAEPNNHISSYSIILTVKSLDSEEHHPLGAITPQKTLGKGGEEAIYQGIANAFAHALLLYLGQKSSPIAPSAEVGQEVGTPVHRSGSQTIRSRSILKSVAKSAAFAIVAVGVVGLLLASAPFMGSNVADPIQTAVAQNMAQDPASITAQVELTKETLRQMGLDPGAAGDLGCLAPR